MKLAIDSSALMNNGSEIPRIGLGVFQNPPGSSTQDAVIKAIEVGYRHIDTAMIYRNEESVGKAILASGVKREEIFLTTKLWNSDHGYEKAFEAFKESTHRLNVSSIDLYLIHWPVYGMRLETWKALEKIYESSGCKAIGVSNYMIKHLKELMNFCSIKPTVNQIELSPFNYQSRKVVIDFCKENDILIEAYSPLTQGQKLNDANLVEIAAHYSKSTAQVLIRWSLQHGFIVLPKSSNAQRIKENIEVFDFEITEEDMNRLDGLDENLVTGWNPVEAP